MEKETIAVFIDAENINTIDFDSINIYIRDLGNIIIYNVCDSKYV